MSQLIIPGLVAVAALTLTYVFCVRPMRNGSHCAMSGMSQAENCGDADYDAEIQRLRAEVASLRRDLSAGQPAIDSSTPGMGPTVRQSN